jgi:single-stranded DNA-binding protein
MTKGIEIAAFCGVTKDGELRTSQAGNSYGLVTLMTDSGNQDDQGRDIPAFLKCIAFADAATVAANLRKGQRAYVEGTLSAGIWQPPDGAPKLDLSVKCSKLEPTQIGRNKPKRNDAPAEYQRPLEQDRPFDDAIGF